MELELVSQLLRLYYLTESVVDKLYVSTEYDGVILTAEKCSTRRNSCPIVTLPNTNTT